MSDYGLKIFEADNERKMTARLVCYNRANQAQNERPIPARVSDRMPGRGGESEQGAQLVGETEKEIAVPKRFAGFIKTAWRVQATFPDGSVAEYHLTENLGLVSDATQITLRATKSGS